ncbi:unnamed protein product [Schistosoma curassoni]|uniref:ATS domain-containing protein n=1 Tax=Schistosoma curassoni TaxID=6186 RepID=A0A183KCJ2_9TREM|nr:unnamed protein product [Schistosoma curassoni]
MRRIRLTMMLMMRIQYQLVIVLTVLNMENHFPNINLMDKMDGYQYKIPVDHIDQTPDDIHYLFVLNDIDDNMDHVYIQPIQKLNMFPNYNKTLD